MKETIAKANRIETTPVRLLVKTNESIGKIDKKYHL